MVYITGDVHGDVRRFQEKKVRKLKKEDYLLICGDFGFIWNGDKEEQKKLAFLSRKRYTILFVEGAHENYELLGKYEIEDWGGGKVRRIAKNILHLMRGQVFTINGESYFTFGGGLSDDKHIRRAQGMWWPEELPSMEEMEEGVLSLNARNRSVDYIVTHEPPGQIKRMINISENKLTSLDIYLNEIMRQVRYKCWYCASLHMDKKIIARHQILYRSILPIL